MEIREASLDDAVAMGSVLQEIIAQTGRDRPNDETTVTSRYLADPARIRCGVAIDEAGEVIGFQSLIRAVAGNPYDLPDGWAFIGTHISPRAHRRGVGSALFAASRQAAGEAGIGKIDAYIGTDNPAALRYYEAMGFRTYRELPGIVQKMFEVD